MIRIENIPAIKWVLAFLMTIFVSSIISIDVRGSLMNFVRHTGYCLFYAAVFFYVRSIRDIEDLLLLCLFLGILLFVVGHFIVPESVLVGLDQKYIDNMGGSYYSPFSGEYTRRVYLVTWNANTTGYLSAFLMFIPLYFLAKKPKKNKYVKPWIYYLCLCILFYFLMKSLSRGAFVTFAIVFVFVIWFYKLKHLGWLGPMFVLLSILLLVTNVLSDLLILVERYLRSCAAIFVVLPFNWKVNTIPDMSLGRLEDIYLSLRVIRENPLLGCGMIPPKAFYSEFSFIVGGMNHLYYMQLICYIGLLGFFFYAMIFYIGFFTLAKTALRLKRSRNQRYLLGGTLAGLFLLILIKGIFAPLGYELWFIMGLSTAFVRIIEESEIDAAIH